MTARDTAITQETRRIAQEFLTRMAAGAEPQQIAALFSEDVGVEIAGDVGALPWIGRKLGRGAIADFVRDVRLYLEPVKFDIETLIAEGGHAVVLGELVSIVKSTGGTIETAFSIVMTVQNSAITRFRMFEDSFTVSKAARGYHISADWTVVTLLKSNLHEVFGQRDRAKRRDAMATLWRSDGVFVDPMGRFVGYDAIDDIIEQILAKFPTFVFKELGEPQAHHGIGRLAWGFGGPGEPPAVTGLDVIVASDDNIVAVYTFLDGRRS